MASHMVCGLCGGHHITSQHTAAITQAAATAKLIRQGGTRATASAAVLAIAHAGPDAVAAAGPGFGRQSKTARKRAKQQTIAGKRRPLMDDDSDDETSNGSGSNHSMGSSSGHMGSNDHLSFASSSPDTSNKTTIGMGMPLSHGGGGVTINSLGRSPPSFGEDLNTHMITTGSPEVKDVGDAPLLDARGRASIPMDDLSMDALIELTRSSPTLSRLQQLTALRCIPRDLLSVIAQYVAVSLDALGEWFEKRGRWRDAFRYYQAAMYADGSATATYKCGMIHLWGMEAAPIDHVKAVTLLTQVMDTCSEARSLYALALCNGYGMPKDDVKAAELWSNGTDCYSQCEWGQVRSNNNDMTSAKKLFEQGMPVIRSRANKGDPRALFFVASCYALGVGGIARDVAKSLPFYARCAAQGHALAQVNMAIVNREGLGGLSADPAAAVRWYRRAAAQNCGDALNTLGFMYERGEGVAVDQKEAVRLYEQAAKVLEPRAMWNLAVSYLHGRGVEQSDDMARLWFEHGAAHHHDGCRRRLDEWNDD